MMAYIYKLAKALYRSPNDSASTYFSTKTCFGLFLLLLGTPCISFLYLMGKDISRWQYSTPTVSIEKKSWKIAESSIEENCEPVLSINCVAHPQNNNLWKSTKYRYNENLKVTARPSGKFWIGTELSKKDLDEALNVEANQLILGWVYGSMQVWINGEFMASTKWADHNPLVVSVPLEWLKKQSSLKIAIKISPDSVGGVPDALARPWTEGLATAEQVAAFKDAAIFWKNSRPLSLFLLNALFSIFFFILWNEQKNKQEYFYFSLYGAVCVLVQLRIMDVFRGFLEANGTTILDTYLYSLEGVFGLLLALSIARARQKFFSSLLYFVFLAPTLSMFFIPSVTARMAFNAHLSRLFVPSCYVVGALICAVQAIAYHQSLGEKKFGKRRVFRLFLFSIGLLFLGVLYAGQFNEWISFLGKIVFSRFGHFGIVLLLASIALNEFREDKKLLERSPVSRYHKTQPLPEALSGAVLSVDLKRSEELFRIGAQRGEAGFLVETCLSHLWSAVLAENGIVLQTEGDGLKAFFDKDACKKNPLVAALKCADLMKLRMDELVSQFRAQEIELPADYTIEFRGGIALGEIKPIWLKAGDIELANWTDSKHSSPLVDSARYMEIERKLESKDSNVIFTSGTLNNIHEDSVHENVTHKQQRFAGKHDRIYLVDVYVPSLFKKDRLKLSA